MSDPILIVCPLTSEPVRTGFRAQRGSDVSYWKNVTLQHCQACGQDHVWNGQMAFWDEEPPAASLWDEVLRIWRAPKRTLL